jgi:hypothetical protein
MTQRARTWIVTIGVSLSMWGAIILAGIEVLQLVSEPATDRLTTASIDR